MAKIRDKIINYHSSIIPNKTALKSCVIGQTEEDKNLRDGEIAVIMTEGAEAIYTLNHDKTDLIEYAPISREEKEQIISLIESGGSSTGGTTDVVYILNDPEVIDNKIPQQTYTELQTAIQEKKVILYNMGDDTNADYVVINNAIADTNGIKFAFTSNDGKLCIVSIATDLTITTSCDDIQTNVLILDYTTDLANAVTGSSVNPEVSEKLLEAIDKGKACVIKNGTSDVLANLQKIGNNVAIVMEQVSYVLGTFAAVNTTITVDTSANTISSLTTGALELTSPLQVSFTSDNKISGATYEELVNAINNKRQIIVTGPFGDIMSVSTSSVVGEQVILVMANGGYMMTATINNDGSYDSSNVQFTDDASTVVMTGYVVATGISEEELTIQETDTLAVALGKLQKQSLDNEDVISSALNRLNSSAGFNENGKYVPTNNAISGATSLAQAIEILAGLVGGASAASFQSVPVTVSAIGTEATATVDSGTTVVNVPLTVTGVTNTVNIQLQLDNGVANDNRLIALDNGSMVKVDTAVSDGNVKVNTGYVSRVLTSSEYQALGDVVATDNVTYFVK